MQRANMIIRKMGTEIYMENPRRKKPWVKQELKKDSTMKESEKKYTRPRHFLLHTPSHTTTQFRTFFHTHYTFKRNKRLSFTQTLDTLKRNWWLTPSWITSNWGRGRAFMAWRKMESCTHSMKTKCNHAFMAWRKRRSFCCWFVKTFTLP